MIVDAVKLAARDPVGVNSFDSTGRNGLSLCLISFREESLKLASLYCRVSLRTPLPSDADFKQKLHCSRKPATFDLEFEQDVLNVIVGCSNDSEAARGNIES